MCVDLVAYVIVVFALLALLGAVLFFALVICFVFSCLVVCVFVCVCSVLVVGCMA